MDYQKNTSELIKKTIKSIERSKVILKSKFIPQYITAQSLPNPKMQAKFKIWDKGFERVLYQSDHCWKTFPFLCSTPNPNLKQCSKRK